MANYIFPNGEVPSVTQVSRIKQGRFVKEDWNNFGADYDPTLMAWYRNFAGHWAELQDRLDHRFFRMWSYLPPVLRRGLPGAQRPALADRPEQGRGDRGSRDLQEDGATLAVPAARAG
jgi:hypothetical protein